MVQILWICAGVIGAYLLYALSRQRLGSSSETVADDVRIFDVPDSMLSQAPVAKQVTVRTADAQQADWWSKKINSPSSSVSRRHQRIEYNQLLLSDLDDNF